MAQICPCANSSFIYLFGDDIDIEEVHKTHESGNAFSDYEEIVRIITDILKPAFVVYRKVVEVKGPENKVPESSKDPLKLELLQIIQEIYWKGWQRAEIFTNCSSSIQWLDY
uniref:Uncharacterized protein n=1 Tax=Nelumbo nucifera TaxID=4432 RepID=A0A822ZMA0_NELNU|nr:TPA_asm: hypothetical protein HUJ06_003830 [Nelumbo nucifera]